MFTKHDVHCAHRASMFNRASIETGATCGCFFCCKVFSPTEYPIKEWTDYQRTALCPFCRIDSIVSSADIKWANDEGFLRAMEKKWFSLSKEDNNG
jgi:hypothetical protein